MAYFTSPPDMVDGQYLSAAQIATYYSQNTSIVWDYARAPTMLQRVLYTGWRGQYPPYSGLIGEWNYGYYSARVRHKYNFLRYRIIVTTSDWTKPHPRIALLLNGTVFKDLEPDLPDVGGGDVTLDGAVVVTPGVAIGQFYDIQLRYSPPVDEWSLDGGIQLVRWYESDSVIGEQIDGEAGSILAFTPPVDFYDGQVITAEQLNANIGNNIDLLYSFARRAIGSFSVVNEGWAQFCDLLLGYGPDSYSRTYYRPDHHRMPYLHYGLVVEWNFSIDNPRLDLIINGVVHDLAALLPDPLIGGLQTVTLEGQIDISSLPIGDAYLVEFRHSPPYETPNAGNWYDAAGHVALHYLYEADADDTTTVPSGWTVPTPPAHLDYVNAATFNVIMHNLIAINAITSARINPVAGEWRWWESGTAPGWRGNGLVIPHRARWLWYETPPENLEDTRPRLLPIWATSTSDQAVTLNESRDGMTKFDLDQVPWLAPGMLYRLLDVAFALEDDD